MEPLLTNIQHTKKLYINTIGCQMNVYDSEQIEKMLRPLGYETVSGPDEADAVIVNTCAIREKAEQKVFSFIGRLAELKRKKPDLLIGVGGCVAQQEGADILKRMPCVDFIFGTSSIIRLPGIIEKVLSSGRPVVDTGVSEGVDEFGFEADGSEEGKVSRFVTIMQGCDNFCTYCVVPYVRGREYSRPPGKIIDEINHLVHTGAREITLLGQNVNSYGKKEGMCSFPELLARIDEIKGLFRIRFTTSHPKDLSDDLIHAFAALEKLCDHIHLPVQAGSDKVLKQMNRKYTQTRYLEKVDQLRKVCPDIAITSDIIVGFPGETRKDFDDTLDLLRKVEFDGLFAFKYSDRPNAPAGRFKNKVSEQEKKDRLQEVLDLQEQYTIKKNQNLIGATEPVLVDGLSKMQDQNKTKNTDCPVQWTGRTTSNKIVNFVVDKGWPFRDKISMGSIVNIRIEKAFSHSLLGKPVGFEPVSVYKKGDESYAA